MPVLQRRRSGPAQRPFETYLQEIDGTSLLNADQERELAVRVQDGDTEARDHLVRANLRLVVNVARHYTGKGLDMEDLIAEGNLGLVRAVEAFDPLRRVRFSTYAIHWIKQSMRRAIHNSGKTVRLPSYMIGLLTKWRRVAARLQDELGRTPSHEEVAAELGLSPKKLKIVQRAIQIHSSGATADPTELDSPLEDVASTPVVGAMLSDDLQQVLNHLDRLDEREASILRLRFGLEGEEPMTLQEIGRRLGLTRERVRQIVSQALGQLREHLEAD